MCWPSGWTRRVFGLFAVALLSFVHCAQAAETSKPALASQEELATQIAIFASDLEQVRHFMGVSPVDPLDLGIRNPLLRDFYAQTLITWKKSNRLLFEIKLVNGMSSTLLPANNRKVDAITNLRDAYKLLRQIMDELQIAPAPSVSPVASPLTATELFNQVVQINRQLDGLLERHLSPSDIFQDLSLAIGYSTRVLSHYPYANRIPLEPPFEPGKPPKAVYLRLISCLETIIRIFNTLDLPILQLDNSHTPPDDLQAIDIYLIISIIIAQLDFLHQHFSIDKPPLQPVYPGPKFPSHNYQRAGILEAQLQQLENLIKTDPPPSLPPARSP